MTKKQNSLKTEDELNNQYFDLIWEKLEILNKENKKYEKNIIYKNN